jgi:hypothetical protein
MAAEFAAAGTAIAAVCPGDAGRPRSACVAVGSDDGQVVEYETRAACAA